MSTVSKNIGWSLVTSLFQIYSGSIIFIILAKVMAINDFGILSFGFSLAAILIVCADFGFSLIVIKDYPQNRFEPKKYVINSLIFKAIISIPVAVLALLYLTLFYSGQWLSIGYLYVLFSIVSSCTGYFQALLKVQNKFRKYSETAFVNALALTVLIFVYWNVEMTLSQFTIYLVLCKTLQLMWSAFLCRNSLGLWLIDKGIMRHLYRNSWSFGFFQVLGIFYFMIDTQIISFYLGAEDVALYQSTFRIMLILLMASDILSNVLLPYISAKFAMNAELKNIYSKVFIFLFIIGCSTFLLFNTFGQAIINLLYPIEYRSAGMLIFPFSIVIIIRTVCSLLGNILTISNRQKYRVISVLITSFISFGLNLYAIPKFGILGAAWVSVIIHMVLLSLYYVYSKREQADMVIFSFENVTILIVTIVIYSVLGHFIPKNLYMILVAIIIWLTTIYAVMLVNNNLQFLKRILSDRGVG